MPAYINDESNMLRTLRIYYKCRKTMLLKEPKSVFETLRTFGFNQHFNFKTLLESRRTTTFYQHSKILYAAFLTPVRSVSQWQAILTTQKQFKHFFHIITTKIQFCKYNDFSLCLIILILCIFRPFRLICVLRNWEIIILYTYGKKKETF